MSGGKAVAVERLPHASACCSRWRGIKCGDKSVRRA